MKINSVMIFLVTLALGACTLDALDENPSLSDSDLQIVSQIISESLSSHGDGVVSSLDDAFEVPTEKGLRRQTAIGIGIGIPVDSLPFQNEQDYDYFYDQAGGVHTTSFTRKGDSEDARQGIYELDYIFLDAKGNFIQNPERDHSLIIAIDYTGFRDGEIINPRKKSTYARTNNYKIEGLGENHSYINVAGNHKGEGSFQSIIGNEEFLSNYFIEIDIQNLQIDKTVLDSNQDLEQGVTGALSYEISIGKQNEKAKRLTGTINLIGDGTGVLRFKDFAEMVTIKLDKGTALNDGKFEGRIKSIVVPAKLFILTSGQRIKVNSATEIDANGAYQSLQQINEAMENGLKITAFGIAERNGVSNNYTATEIIFKRENADSNNM
ncbi:MAG: hypothetical protein WD037_07395 [Balneolales bacterium]